MSQKISKQKSRISEICANQNSASSILQQRDQLLIGFGERICTKARGLDPAEFGDADRARRSCSDRANEEVEAHASLRIFVHCGEAFFEYIDLNSQFFSNFSLQRDLQRLAFFDLSAGELPESGQVRACRPPADQNPALIANNCCNDCDHALDQMLTIFVSAADFLC